MRSALPARPNFTCLPIEIWYTLLLSAIFLLCSSRYHLPIYPGYFLLQTLALVLFAWWLRDAVRHGPDFPTIMTAPTVLFLWTIATAAWARQAWAVPDGLLRMVTFTFLVLGLGHLLRRHPSLHARLWDITLGCFALFVLQYFDSIRRHGYFTPPFMNPNFAATIAGFMAALALARAACYGAARLQRRMAINLVLAIWFATLVVMCGAKGAIISLALSCSLILGLRFRPLRRWLALGFGLSAAVVGWWWPLLRHHLWLSLEVRLHVWQATWAMATDSPLRLLFGWGPGNFFPNFPDFLSVHFFTSAYQAPVVDFPHNFCLELLVEYGLVGLLLFGWLIFEVMRHAWQTFRHHTNLDRQADSLAIICGVTMLMLDIQSSLGMSYAQGQLLLALTIAWLAGAAPMTAGTVGSHIRMLRLPAAILPLAGIMLALFWKYYSWDALCFQRQYQRAVTSLTRELRVERGLAVSLPLCENYYTCQWRNELGVWVIDAYDQLRTSHTPDELTALLAPFFRLEERMPRFGFFLLYRAIWEARQQHREQASHYFGQFAEKNPFAPELWLWWGRVCGQRDANPALMAQCARLMQQRYGQDGALLCGEALACDALGDFANARHLMTQASAWAKARLARRFEARVAQIVEIAETYLARSNRSKKQP